MAERRSWILRSRFAMQVCHWAKCGFGGRAAVEKPRNFLANRNRIQHGQLCENIMGMLMVNEREAMISLPGLEQLWESRMRRGQRLGGKHFAKQQGS